MSLFTFGKDRQKNRAREAERTEGCPYAKRTRIAGNVFFALFAAVAMVGTIGYGLNTVMRGPITTMTEVTRRTVAESTVVTSSRMAIVGATTQQTNADCDNDGMVEPLPFRDPAGGPAPVGGGYLPTNLVPNSFDPWKTEYGYCAWDGGSVVHHANCGATPNRLAGGPDNRQQIIAIVSAGRDKVFQTSCVAYNAGDPTAQLIVKPDGSDDIVLGYTYAEANDLGAGMWRPDPADPDNMAETRSALHGTGSATFGDAVVLQGNILTGGGLVLPGDPGDGSLTGFCNAANDRQIRRNTSTTPPTLEICNLAAGPNWMPLSGTGSGDDGSGITGTLMAHWRLDEGTGSIARDSIGGHHGFIQNIATWSNDSVNGGSISFLNANNAYIRAARSPALESDAVTVSMWVKRNGAQPDWAGLLTKTWNDNGGPTNQSYGLMFWNNSDTMVQFVIGFDGAQESVFFDGIPDQAWTHVVGTYDPALATDQMKIYINGALQSARTLTQPIVYDPTDSGDIHIGRTHRNTTEGFNGQIDDVRIYNTAISASAIQNLYNQALPTGMHNISAGKTGRMLTWGENSNAELGNGTGPNGTIHHFPTAVRDGNDFLQVDMGPGHACGLKAGGTVWCWGNDANGRLGNGPDITATQNVPTQVLNLEKVIQLSTGAEHNCAVKQDGTAWCWGRGNAGQLGNNDTSDSDIPVQVSNITDFTFVTAGGGSSCGIRQNGTGWCWGTGNGGRLGNGSTSQSTVPVQISDIDNWATINIGGSSACGVTKDGRAYCWGTEAGGSFGNGATATQQNVPAAVLDSAGTDVWTDWVDIQTNSDVTCGVRTNGTGWCWGDDWAGRIGNGDVTTNDRILPTQVALYSDFKKIAVGSTAVCGIRRNGNVVCWGDDSEGDLANGSHVTGDQTAPYPTPIKNALDIAMHDDNGIALIDTSIRPVIREPAGIGKINSTTGGTRCAIDTDDTGWCWGTNHFAELGTGNTNGQHEALPKKLADDGPWMRFATDGAIRYSAANCAIKGDGTLWCWGVDNNGILGNGPGVTANQNAPYQVDDLGPWSAVSLSETTACAIKVDGTLWCWGRLMGSNNPSPVQVGTNYLWKKIATGIESFCGITTDGTAMCQGLGTDGVLGNGQTAASNYALSPVLEKGPWIQISMGGPVTCGVKADGTAWCWGNASDGYGANGRLGTGFATGVFSRPQLVADHGPWSYIATGGERTFAIKTDGTLWGWGVDWDGELGIGITGVNRPYPVSIVGGGKWIGVHANTCGMKEDKSVWCWGYNDGYLGLGPQITGHQSRPQRVYNFPRPDPWIGSEDGGGLNLRTGVGVGIGTQRYISGTGAATEGLRLEGGGRSSLNSAAGMQQLIIEAATGTFAAQLNLKAESIHGTTTQSGIGGHWRLDEASGTVASDSAGNSPGVTINNPTWQPAGGRVGGGVTFSNATNGRIRISRTPDLEPESVTVSAWVRRSGSAGGFPGLVYKTYQNDSDPYVSYGLYMDGASERAVWSIGTTFGHIYVAASDPLPDNQWVHLTGVYDPNGPAPQLRLYVNGASDATHTIDVPMLYDTTDSGDLYIGASSYDASVGLSGTSFNGSIDDVQIYGRALLDDEILEVYGGATIGANGPTLNRLVGADPRNSTLKFSRDGTGQNKWLSELAADMEFSMAGNVGIGTGGSPQAKLDVRGAIKIGEDGGGCSGTNAGTIQRTGGDWQYCDGANWQSFVPDSAGGGDAYWATNNKSLSLGIVFGCARQANGTGWCWGDLDYGGFNNPVQVPDSAGTGYWNDWLKSTLGNHHICAIRTNGEMWCGGRGGSGQLGNGATPFLSPLPTLVLRDVGGGGWNDWIDLDGGGVHSCGIRRTGQAYCWGEGNHGELGNDAPGTSNRPVLVLTTDGLSSWSDWVQISAGGDHTCGIRVDGSAWCWGGSASGQGGYEYFGHLFTPQAVRTDVSGPATWNDWIQISTGTEHTCGIRSDGSAWCWGGVHNGMLGNGDDTTNVSLPNRVQTTTGPGGWYNWTQISAGHSHTCGIRADGTAWCWGEAWLGQLGNDDIPAQSRPVQVKTEDGAGYWNDWVSITAGHYYSCGVRVDSSMWCWGENGSAQLGIGTAGGNRTLPTRVEMAP